MRKAGIVALFLLSFSFMSCVIVTGNLEETYSTGAGAAKEKQAPGASQSKVLIKNNSDFDVNVYTVSPYYSDSPDFTVKARQTVTKYMKPSQVSVGDLFYFQYLIKIGSASFPYFSFDSQECYKYLLIKENQNAELTIDALKSCKSESAYILLENNTTSGIYMLNGVNFVHPYGYADFNVPAGAGSAVYQLGQTDTQITLDSLKLVKVVSGTREYELPFTKAEKGKIYTISLNEGEAPGTSSRLTLKAVTPFNIDTQKRIWSFNNSSLIVSDTVKPVIKSAADMEGGFFLAGTVKNQPKQIAVYNVNPYGLVRQGYKLTFNVEKLVQVGVLDFCQGSDDSYVFLLREFFEDEKGSCTKHYLTKYDCSQKKIFWEYCFEDNGIKVEWPLESGNALNKIDDNKFLVAGAKNGSEFLGIINAGSESLELKSYVSSKVSSRGSQFTSSYYDGKDIYVTGFEGWASDYSSDYFSDYFSDYSNGYSSLNSRGFIYRFSPDDLSEYEVVYEKEGAVLSCIKGEGEDFYACGEFIDSGIIKKGLYITSRQIKNKKEAFLYVTGKAHCGLEKICLYQNKIILSGTSADDMAFSKNSQPFILAFDLKGNKLWENNSYSKYKKALNIIPNTVGSFIIQLEEVDSSNVHYVSGDLLGNEKK